MQPEPPPDLMTLPASGDATMISLASQRWWLEAACRDEELGLFFGPDGERQPERDIREARAKVVCARCLVRAACLDYAVGKPEKYGYWGQMGEDERAHERKRRQRKANARRNRAAA